MKQFKSKTCLRIPPTKQKLNSQQKLQKTQASKEKDENLEFSFVNQVNYYEIQYTFQPFFSRSLSNGQKPIQVQLVILQNQKKNKEQIQDYQNHIKPIEDTYKEEFISQLIEDSIQFEALFYQMAQNKLFIAPVTSSPPLIAYYIFCLIVGYKYPDPEILTRHLNNQFDDFKSLLDMIEIGNQQLPLKFLLLSESVLPGIQKWNLVRLFANYNWQMLKLLNQQDSFNLKLATDDFLKYSDLYQNNKTEIEQHLQQEIYKKQNICIGLIRLIFIYPDKETTFNIRIPLGDFNEENSFNFKDIKGKNSFANDAWYTHPQGGQSERMLLAWLVLHQDIIIHLILQQITQINQDIMDLILAKVYFEITSERRVCNQCVIMLTKFRFNDFINDCSKSKFLIQRLQSLKTHSLILNIITIRKYIQYWSHNTYVNLKNKESGSDNQSRVGLFR